MTPSQQAKAAGLKSLLQVSELTGVSIQTLSNWAKNKPELFEVVINGCLVKWIEQLDKNS
jgi:transcriptional regulator with XRE-family HTH domain